MSMQLSYLHVMRVAATLLLRKESISLRGATNTDLLSHDSNFTPKLLCLAFDEAD